MYPAYKVADVLNEYAITFFALLNEGYRRRNRHYLVLAQLADLPYLKRDDRAKFYRQLHWATSEPDAILKTGKRSSSPAEIKKILRG